jgi:hypothetical protein
MIKNFPRARSERDITRVSGTLSPSSILGGRTNLKFQANLSAIHSFKNLIVTKFVTVPCRAGLSVSV